VDQLPVEAEAAILRLFADSAEAQFSLTRIALHGAEHGIPVGRWMGPASIAQVLAQLAARGRPAAACTRAPADAPHAPSNGANSALAPARDSAYTGHTPGSISASSAAPACPALAAPGVRILVAMDGIVYCDEVRSAAQPDGDEWEPLLLLIPLRLGLDKFTPAYAPTVLGLMRMPQCVGVIGGRPRSSYYFIGQQADRLLYLDPHEIQPALDLDAPQLPTCHFTRPVRTMRLADIDPSLAFGFLLSSRDSLDDFCHRTAAVASGGALPAFSVAGARPAYERQSGRVQAGEFDGEDEDDDDLVVV
jgi:cysteine protease ATG4